MSRCVVREDTSFESVVIRQYFRNVFHNAKKSRLIRLWTLHDNTFIH